MFVFSMLLLVYGMGYRKKEDLRCMIPGCIAGSFCCIIFSAIGESVG